MEQRHHVEAPVIGHQLQRLDHVARSRHKVRVRQRHLLGTGSGARGVQDQCDIFGAWPGLVDCPGAIGSRDSSGDPTNAEPQQRDPAPFGHLFGGTTLPVEHDDCSGLEHFN